MSPSHWAKWVFTFVLLFITIGWAMYALHMVGDAVAEPTATNVLEASGTSVLLGALIGWNVMTIQHWFRKATPE